MSKRERLNQQISESEARWQRLGIRLGKLKLACEIETRLEERLRLEPLIEEVAASRAAAGAELAALEAQLEALGTASASAAPGLPLLFWSHAPADESLCDELFRCMSSLPGACSLQHFRSQSIVLGEEPGHMVKQKLSEARVIVLLVSADYLSSDELERSELRPAMLRHESGEALVIPIILRACLWESSPFAKLQVLPKGGVPIQSWPDRELVVEDVAARLHEAALRLAAHKHLMRD